MVDDGPERCLQECDGVKSGKKIRKKGKATKSSKNPVSVNDTRRGGSSSSKSLKSCRGKKWAKMNKIHGLTCSLSYNNLVCDSE